MGIRSSRTFQWKKKKRRKKRKKKKASLGALLKHSHRLWVPVVTAGRTSPQLTCPPSFPLPHLGWHLAPAPPKEAGSFPREAVPAPGAAGCLPSPGLGQEGCSEYHRKDQQTWGLTQHCQVTFFFLFPLRNARCKIAATRFLHLQLGGYSICTGVWTGFQAYSSPQI